MFGRRDLSEFGALAVGIGLLNLVLGLAFWLGLIAGTLYLVKHFFF